jgi:hypothetical protein
MIKNPGLVGGVNKLQMFISMNRGTCFFSVTAERVLVLLGCYFGFSLG